MKTVYFVRHGESEANAGHPVYQGKESKLTERGREQAKFIAERCGNLSFDVLLASNYVRAVETAQMVAEKVGKDLETNDVFGERHGPSSLLGKSRSDPKTQKLEMKWWNSLLREDLRVEDGENFEDLKKRAITALQYLAARPESSILVVSHGFFLRTLFAAVLFGDSLTVSEFKSVIVTARMVENTGLTVFEYGKRELETGEKIPDRWYVRTWNDHAHLG